ncbi:hypothetical protein CDL15_Pgr024416 [Punica granatum]|uniref:Uncharacterized protein n=1 Tax=Punica granatum TaxID=22663 RepID=A0A218XY13_PUNGR|nr:hypothetical protein CDL15_Pgr024416 [Punica granatum]
MKRRGAEDVDLVMVDPWTPGYHNEANAPNLDGLRILIYMQNMVVLEFEDRKLGERFEDGKLVPLRPVNSFRNYTSAETRGTANRRDLKPLHITQAEGPSFCALCQMAKDQSSSRN